MAPHSFKPGVATPLKQNAFSKTDHHFTCWNTKADGTGTSYAAEASLTLEADLTIYAQWFDGVLITASTTTLTCGPFCIVYS